MDELKKLRDIVCDLEGTSGKEEQVRILQKIGALLLTDYVIKVGDITIEPLWVEAYYYNEKNGFTDDTVHRNEAQYNHFGQLYFHHQKGDQRSGVDICLSTGNYCLSFLLKYTLVNGEFTSQSKLHDKICSEYKENQQILVSQQRPAKIVQHTFRIGINSGKYKDEKLAAVRDVNRRFTDSNGQLQSLPNKIAIIKEYIETVYQEEEKATEEQKRVISKALVGEYWKDLFS